MSLGRSVRINKSAVLILLVVSLTVIYFCSISSEKASNAFLKGEINLRKLLIGSIQAARKGGLEIVEISKSSAFNKKSKGKTKEGADDPITDADTRSHCVMKQGLLRIFPTLEIISEEDKSHTKCEKGKNFDLDPTVLQEALLLPDELVDIKDVTVWIDPLDATQEYTEKLFQYVTTMVCVAVKGVPIIGVIHNPFTQQTTWAWVDRALSEDLHKIKKEDTITMNPIVIVSRSHAGDVKNISKTVFGKNAHVTFAAGAGYKTLQVASNSVTAYLHTTRIKKWDICAGNAILNALGGRLTNLLNEEIEYSSSENVVNDKGLLGTLNNHEYYINKIKMNKIMI